MIQIRSFYERLYTGTALLSHRIDSPAFNSLDVAESSVTLAVSLTID